MTKKCFCVDREKELEERFDELKKANTKLVDILIGQQKQIAKLAKVVKTAKEYIEPFCGVTLNYASNKRLKPACEALAELGEGDG